MAIYRTSEEWISRLKEGIVKHKWKNYANLSSAKFEKLHDALWYSFNWTESAEGAEYWDNIHSEMKKYPARFLRFDMDQIAAEKNEGKKIKKLPFNEIDTDKIVGKVNEIIHHLNMMG